ncbi:MAG: acetate--CoA ligase family protein [Candidatus Marinimicrobia bacterium]|nr:acetate--CoA ligase family protein [Candidatus Neomarinimicrobiota bacterium]
MAKLHEHQGKVLFKEAGIPVPEGSLASSPDEAAEIASKLKSPVVIKMQAWTTGRAGLGGIIFADSPKQARDGAADILGKEVENFVVENVLVEKKLNIEKEFYAGIVIDDKSRKPAMIFSSVGGTGIEEIAQKFPDKISRMSIDVIEGLKDYQARELVKRTGLTGKLQLRIAGILVKLFNLARKYEMRSAEINPLVLTDEDKLIAADSRITIDDSAVFKHPELGIEIARELDHPPSELDKIAWNVEKDDYRGTFYFIQMAQGFSMEERYVGFHGAGGGGSMMSMDALMNKGFKLANFVDTSGNPPASKVYRAAKIILSQKNIVGYFGSGSGVASQEQFHSARGLVKAFREENISIPVVIRLGGNQEDKAIEILTNYTADLPAPVEGYKKNDSADFCADRMKALVDSFDYSSANGASFVPPKAEKPYSFKTLTGEITYDHALCLDCKDKPCIESCGPEILKLEDNLPVLAISDEDAAKGKCTECLACEQECYFHGNKGAYISLPIEGLVN